MDWVLWSCGGEDALSSGTVNSWMVSVWACEREGVPLPSHPQVAHRVFQKVLSFKDPPSKYMTQEKWTVMIKQTSFLVLNIEIESS